MRKPDYKVTIRGDSWPIYVLDDDIFDTSYGKGNLAVTTYNDQKRFIFFRASHIYKDTIIHEVTHAFFSYQYLDSAKLSTKQVEEVFCEFLANNLESIRRISNNIYKALK